jgi:hypothetical protein
MNVDSSAGPIIDCRDPTTETTEPDTQPRSTVLPSGNENYLRACEQRERTAAKLASTAVARGIHQELARRYAMRALNSDKTAR